MFSKIVWTLMILITLSHSQHENDIKSQVERIDSNRFGKTILDTVYLQLKTQEPIERLQSTLEYIEDQYTNDQREDDDKHKEFQSACDQDISAYDKQLSVLDQEQIRYTAKLEGELLPRLSIVQDLIKQKETEVKQLNKDLAQLQADRSEQAAEFELQMEEHMTIINIIMETKRLFADQTNPDQEFLQLQTQQRGQQLQVFLIQSIKSAQRFNYRKSWSGILKALVTITSKVELSNDSFQRIVELCDQLIEKIDDSIDLDRFTEEKRIQSFTKQQNLLTISINVSNTSLLNAQSDQTLYQISMKIVQMHQLNKLKPNWIIHFKGLIILLKIDKIDTYNVRKKPMSI